MTIQFIEKSVYVRFLVMGYVSQHEFDQEYMVVGYIVGSHSLGGCINFRTAPDIEIVADRYIGMVPQPVQPGDLLERGTLREPTNGTDIRHRYPFHTVPGTASLFNFPCMRFDFGHRDLMVH